MQRLVSDDGGVYRSHAWRDGCAKLDIKPFDEAPHAGRTDGRPLARNDAVGD